jgi:hypothetical protein
MEIALIHNNSLILGPMGFNVRMINSELEELEVQETITTQSYTTLPIHFSDNLTHLLPLEKDIPSYDPKYYNVGNFTWQIIEENGVPIKVLLTYPTIEKTLEEVKTLRKSEVAPERWNKENTTVTVTLYNREITVSTSRENRLAIVSKVVSDGGLHNFKFNDDTWVEISKTDLVTILNAIDDVVQAAFDWEYAKLAEIDACLTIDDVYAVVIIEPVV